jgi:hypothetical protein
MGKEASNGKLFFLMLQGLIRKLRTIKARAITAI